MNLKFYIFILTVVFSGFSLACSNSRAATENRIEVVIDDGYKADELVIDDRNLNLNNLPGSVSAQNLEETKKTLGDLSEVTTRYDRYGNKTETRNFKNHPRLSLVVLETGKNGQQRVYVYGYGKEVKNLPDEMINKALTAPGDEIANSAGLYKTHSNTEIKNFKKPSKPLQPLPSSSFPIRTPQNIQPQPEPEKQNTEQQVVENTSNPAEGEQKEPLN